MTRCVYKYPFPTSDAAPIRVGPNPIVRHVGLDPEGKACLWIEVDAVDSSLHTHVVKVRGTGHGIEPQDNFLGTYVAGPFVWHVYSPTLSKGK